MISEGKKIFRQSLVLGLAFVIHFLLVRVGLLTPLVELARQGTGWPAQLVMVKFGLSIFFLISESCIFFCFAGGRDHFLNVTNHEII